MVICYIYINMNYIYMNYVCIYTFTRTDAQAQGQLRPGDILFAVDSTPVYRAPLNLVASKLLGYSYSCADLIFVYAFVYTCIYTYSICICVCVYMYIYTYTYVYTIRCGQLSCLPRASSSCCEQVARVFLYTCYIHVCVFCIVCVLYAYNMVCVWCMCTT